MDYKKVLIDTMQELRNKKDMPLDALWLIDDTLRKIREDEQ